MSDRLPNVHPGTILANEFLAPLDLTVSEVAAATGIFPEHLHHLVLGQVSVTERVAVRLAAYFGTSAELWLNLQQSYNLEEYQKDLSAEAKAKIAAIQPHPRVLELQNTPIPTESAEDASRRTPQIATHIKKAFADAFVDTIKASGWYPSELTEINDPYKPTYDIQSSPEEDCPHWDDVGRKDVDAAINAGLVAAITARDAEPKRDA